MSRGRTSGGWRALAAGLATVGALACARHDQPAPAGSAAPGPGGEASLASVRSLIEQGQLDEALQRLGEHGQDAEGLYLQGRIWAKKAETAPLPTPRPEGSAPEFKPEELQAVAFFEKAVAARPDYAAAHVALAELLAPHALRRQAAARPAEAPVRTRRGRKPAAAPVAPLPDTAGVDASVDRVIRAYQFALQADQASITLPEALIGFGIQAGRIDAADLGHQELLKRQREKPEPFIRYGDFLLNHKQDQEGAVEQYRQALIWRPDDDATRGKIADIYLAQGAQSFEHQQFALAEQQFAQATKWITDRSSAQARRLADYQARLREIRVR